MPGTIGTPAASIRAREAVFEPIAAMEEGFGPTHVSPAAITALANSAFSERKPKPGWTIVAPVFLAAARSFSGTRYDSRAGAGPIGTATSARRTWSAARSASEKTTTASIPRSRHARTMRTAISPRFLPCFFGGTTSRLFSRRRSARIRRLRVARGAMTSSM